MILLSFFPYLQENGKSNDAESCTKERISVSIILEISGELSKRTSFTSYGFFFSFCQVSVLFLYKMTNPLDVKSFKRIYCKFLYTLYMRKW